MRILLIVPSQRDTYGEMKAPEQIHMGLAYIGAVLEKNKYDVRVLDVDAQRLTPDKLAKNILDEKIDVAGITVTTPTLNPSLKLAKTIKRFSPATLIAFGGMHPSVMTAETIAYPEVDFLIKGEGEITFLELLSAIKNNSDLSHVDGLAFKRGGEIIRNKDRALIKNLDSLPFPARRLFRNTAYTYPDSLYARTAPIITSRGCPGRCTYCNAQSIFGRGFRARSAENVADEIQLSIKDFNIKEIHVWDDNFVTQKERVFRIRDEVRKRDIRVKFAFPNGIRADFLDEKVIRALKEMGTYSIAIGVESGNIEVLGTARKGIKLERVIKAFELAKKLHLETWAFFMFGLPGEDINAANDTINFAKKLDPDIAKFHILKPYPGTEVYDYLLRRGLLDSLDYKDYGIHTFPVHHLEKLTEEDLFKLQKRAYKEFYFRPLKLLKQILRLKSYYRLKLNLKAALNISKIAFKN